MKPLYYNNSSLNPFHATLNPQHVICRAVPGNSYSSFLLQTRQGYICGRVCEAVHIMNHAMHSTVISNRRQASLVDALRQRHRFQYQ